MSDGRKVLGAVKQSLTKLYPNMTGHEASHFGTMLQMITGMVASNHCHLPKIAGKIKNNIKQESQIKKLKRWLDNKDVNGDLFFYHFSINCSQCSCKAP